MRTLSIRQWMLVGLVIFLAAAALFYHVANLLDESLLQPSAQQVQRENAALDSALREVASNPAGWRDPAWQAALASQFSPLGVTILVKDSSGAQLFRTGSPHSPAQPSRSATVIDGGQELGTVELFAPPRIDPLAPLAAVLAVVLALAFVRLQMGRYVVRPLDAMSRAARRIAGGDLEFDLPESRVKEVAEVRDAFDAMGDGLRRSLKRQAELEQERRFFISAIAHDLRTPLFALRGYLVGLEQGLAGSPERAARYIAICREKSDQLDRLVSDLFAYTKAETLDQSLQRERLEIGPLLQKAVDGLWQRAADKGVAITLDGPEEPCAMVEGDEHLLERALENLFDNAVRHTPPGGRIAITWRTKDGRVTFGVADTGPGIEARDLPHLFEPLYRGEASRNRETGGAGLGLTIARRILRAHGGDLVADNGPDGGARFTGWLAAMTGEGLGVTVTPYILKPWT